MTNQTSHILETNPAAIVPSNFENWANGLGFDCTIANTHFSILHDKALNRFEIVREDNNGEKTHWIRLDYGVIIQEQTEQADLALRLWNEQRDQWSITI